MAKQCARSASIVRFAELFVTSKCSGNRSLSSRLESPRRGSAWAGGVATLGAALTCGEGSRNSKLSGSSPTKSRGKRSLRFAKLILALCAIAFATMFPHRSSAQQISYYDFNIPSAASPSQTSTSCGPNSASSGVLFCLNSAPGNIGLGFIQDFYPSSIDPNASTDGGAGSTNSALQLTPPAGGQVSSVWYSTPQNVANGFTVWYAVKLTPAISGSNCCTADGLAFVIQNAAGGKPADPVSGSSETGSGLSVLGEGGGGLGYGGIDNSVALEMDTFYDSPWDPSDNGSNDDNHIALQSCGPGVANSPAHLGTGNCLITLGNGNSTLVSNPKSSASSPSAVILADGNPHQIVIVYNGANDSPANYLYVYLDPAFTPGTHTPVAGSTPLFSGPFDITKYISLNNGTAYIGFTSATGFNFEQHELMGFSFTQHNFASANVCPTGQTTPSPCSSTLAVPFSFASSTTIGSVQVVTQGTTGLDFQPGSGNTCTGPVTSCAVNVTFAPIAPGLRLGAVELLDSSGNLLATRMIYGVGQGPAVAFSPGTQVSVYSGNSPYVVAGTEVDAAGDLFIAENQGTGNNNGLVVKVAANGPQTSFGPTLPTPLEYPQGLAMDGAGNLYIADNNKNAVIEIPAGCNSSCAQEQILPNPLGLRSQLGVAVDGAGDVFFSDFLDGEVGEVPASGGAETVVYSPGTGSTPVSGSSPVGLAVDAAGEVFIADFGLKKVVEIPPGCTSSGCQIPIGAGWDQPEAVAVDAAGDVFVADETLGEVEVPTGCTNNNNNCQITVSGVLAYGVAVDGKGDIFIPDLYGNQVGEINKSLPPSLAFPTATNVGSTDTTDGAKTVTLQNVGNATLIFPVPPSGDNPSIGPDFSLYSNGQGDCPLTTTSSSSPGTLAAGALCVYSVTFDPITAGNPLSESLALTDNNLNAISPSPAATQTIALSGVSLGANYTLTVSTAGSGSGAVSGMNCSTGSYPSGTTVTCTETPAGGSQFSGWSGGTCTGTGSCMFSLGSNSSVVANFTQYYPLSVLALGTGVGTVTSSPGGINCGVNDGVSSGTCSGSYPTGASVTLTATAAPSYVFNGWSGTCASAGTNPVCNVIVGPVSNVIAVFVPQNFGNVNVCPAGQSTPTPCSATFALTFNMTATTNIGAIQVVTQGIGGLDFSLGSGSTCNGTFYAGNSCAVNVTFTPFAPGLRTGAVRLYDNIGNLVATTQVYGIGQAPSSAFSPGTQIAVNAGTLGSPRGVAVNAEGDIFVSDYQNKSVVKISAASGTPASVSTGSLSLGGPTGLAVDGAGDLFIADSPNNRVVEVPALGTPSLVSTGTYALSDPSGLAIDGAGDLLITDSGNNRVVEVPAGGGTPTLVNTGSFTLTQPTGVAVDGAGDVFVADLNAAQKRVVEVPATGSPALVNTSTYPLGSPQGIAVDAAGDVLIADAGNNRILEVTPGGSQSTVESTGAGQPYGIAVDGTGDVFTASIGLNQVSELARFLPPSFSFALTNMGSTSADSPQLVSIQNTGNQPLMGSLALSSLGASFISNPTSTCGSGFMLAPGVACSESFSFTPQTTGYLTGTAVFSDNTLNLSPSVVVQAVSLAGNGGLNGQAVGVAVPNVVGLTQSAAATALTGAGLASGTVSTASNSVVPSGSVIASNPAAGTQVNVGSAVRLLVSTGQAPLPTPNPLSFENNYFVTGDFATGGVTLRGTGHGGMATGSITIPDLTASPGSQGVPDGADIIDGFLYWETVENTASASGNNGTFLGYPITGQQIGSDLPNYNDGSITGTLRVYRADINAYFPVGANGVRIASGAFTVSLPDGGGTQFPHTEGASLVVIYRVLSQNFPLKAVIIYDGSAIPTASTTQNMQGFYDAAGTGESTSLFAAGGSWNDSSGSVALSAHANQFSAPLNAGNAYAAVILSTPVTNSDHDGILDAWKAGPAAGDFYAGQPGYYDVKTGSWVPLPGAQHGHKDLFVQLDYMCGAVLPTGVCDPNQENLFPSPDAQGNDPLAMITQAYTAIGITLHLEVGNAVPETTCADSPGQLCQFPREAGVIGWKNSLEFSKLWPRNLASCAAGGDCSPRFPYGQKDSYHYVLFGHSLAIPAWNARYGTLTSIQVVSGVTTIVTADRGTGINECPSRITISGVLGNPSLNGVYNTSSCSDSQHITVATPGVPNWSYPNSTLPEPVIGLTSGTVTSISGYSDLGGADSAVTLGLWETAAGQDMSKRANVIAGTLFHEIGHTLGLSHGGLYYDGGSGSYIPTFDVNCKPNYQSVMNYLFQLDGVGPNAAVAYSNQTLTQLSDASLSMETQLTDTDPGFVGNPATFSTSAWYSTTAPSPTASPATLHCDGTPLTGDTGYRVNGTVAPVSPAWSNGQNITFDGVPYSQLRGYNDVANIDLRQVGATGGEFASLASVLSFGSSESPLNIAAGGNVTLGAGGTVALGAGGTVALGAGGNVTLGSAGTVSGGSVTLNNGGTATLSTGGTITLSNGGNVTLGAGGNVTLGAGGTITYASGGGNVALWRGRDSDTGGWRHHLSQWRRLGDDSLHGRNLHNTRGGGTIALGAGGKVALGAGGNVTLGAGGTIALGAGGTVALGAGGNVTLGAGGTIALGGGGTVALGAGGNVTLGAGGTVALGLAAM